MPFCKTQMKLFQYVLYVCMYTQLFFSGILKLRYKFNLTMTVKKKERNIEIETAIFRFMTKNFCRLITITMIINKW